MTAPNVCPACASGNCGACTRALAPCDCAKHEGAGRDAYQHITTAEGKLRASVVLGDPVIEELYGMTWWLAVKLAVALERRAGEPAGSIHPADLVEDARQHWAEGVDECSPGIGNEPRSA